MICKFFLELGFVQLREDLCVFVLFVDGKIVAVVALYVDDILLGVDTVARKEWFVSTITARFKTKVIGLPTNVVVITLPRVHY